MVSLPRDSCEPSIPGLLKFGPEGTFNDAVRVQQALTAGLERRVLIRIAKSLPAWVSPDQLTVLGLAAQIMAGASFAMARFDQRWLLAVSVCLALNWFGDSLDGTLARVRRQQRPRYGFYVDHMVDSFGALALMGGMALSGYMHPALAIGLLVGFLLLSIQSYLATYTLGEFQLSFWRFGPTELRILLVVGSLALLRRTMVFGGRFRLFDVGGAIALSTMMLMLIAVTARNLTRLGREEKVQ